MMNGLSLRSRRLHLAWLDVDAETEQFGASTEAQRLFRREGRDGFKIARDVGGQPARDCDTRPATARADACSSSSP